MKLATLRNGTRDGQLMVVSRDLTRALPVPKIATTLQGALDKLDPVMLQLPAYERPLPGEGRPSRPRGRRNPPQQPQPR